jgi:hypothetical protein
VATHRCASRARRCPQRTLPRFWQSVTDAHKALGEGWVRDAERYQLDRTLIHIDLDELDPLPERDGTLPKGQAAKENTPATGSIAPSPQAALRRYALTYTDWQATSLPAHERQIASLAVAAARLAAEQTAALLEARGCLLLLNPFDLIGRFKHTDSATNGCISAHLSAPDRQPSAKAVLRWLSPGRGR